MNDTVTPADSEKTWYERHWRWFVLATLFLATFLNYMDRQTLGLAIEPICQEFDLDNVYRGKLLASFIYSYALAHLFIGFILDRTRNLRRFFPIMVLGWSASNMLVGFAQDYTQVLWLRYLLGICESANFPICLLIIARIFPAHERTFAAGIFNAGASVATTLAPKLVIFLTTHWSWRMSFVVTGSLGLLWLIPWLLIFKKPEERALYWPDFDAERALPKEQAGGLFEIFRLPAFWAVALIGMGIIPGWYFMSVWLPSYLTQALGMPYDQALGNKLMIVYFIQDLGLLASGLIVWKLSKMGFSVLNARKSVITLAFCLMMSVVFIGRVQSTGLIILILSLYFFGLSAWQANQQSFKQDVLRRRVGTVAALVGFAETGFAAIINEKAGVLTQDTEGYYTVFFLLAGMFTFALVVVHAMLRPRWIKIS